MLHDRPFPLPTPVHFFLFGPTGKSVAVGGRPYKLFQSWTLAVFHLLTSRDNPQISHCGLDLNRGPISRELGTFLELSASVSTILRAPMRVLGRRAHLSRMGRSAQHLACVSHLALEIAIPARRVDLCTVAGARTGRRYSRGFHATGCLAS